jgi:ribonuclease P protein component
LRAAIVADTRFPKAERIRKRAEFLSVQRNGIKGHADHFLIFHRAGSGATTRLGVTVTKKVGGAVVRNRIKRLIREVFRQNKDSVPPGLDVVVVAKQQPKVESGQPGSRPAIQELTYASVKADLEAFWKRARRRGGR